VVICLERGADCLRTVQLMPLPSQTPSSLASFKSRLVLPFWYRLTQVVPEKRSLHGCSSSSSSSEYSAVISKLVQKLSDTAVMQSAIKSLTHRLQYSWIHHLHHLLIQLRHLGWVNVLRHVTTCNQHTITSALLTETARNARNLLELQI